MATRSKFHDKEAAYSADVPINDNNTEGWAQDDKDMARMGKRQEFKRNFSWISSIGFTSCTMDKSIIPSLHMLDADLQVYVPDKSPTFLPHLMWY